MKEKTQDKWEWVGVIILVAIVVAMGILTYQLHQERKKIDASIDQMYADLHEMEDCYADMERRLVEIDEHLDAMAWLIHQEGDPPPIIMNLTEPPTLPGEPVPVEEGDPEYGDLINDILHALRELFGDPLPKPEVP